MQKKILEKYYLLKKNNFLEIEKDLLGKARKEKETIFCKIKCYYCCSSYLIGPEIEMELIFYFLQKSKFLQNKLEER